MLKNLLRRACAAWLAVSLLGVSALALDRGKIETEFDEILYQIERYGLFAEDNEMSDADRAAYNKRIAGGEDLVDVVNEVLEKHDSHSYYMRPETYNDSFTTLTNRYVGVGVTIQMKGSQAVVSEVNFSGPAREAGVEVGDVLIEANGVKLAGKNLNEIAALLQGESGSTVRLTVQRGGRLHTMTMTRREIHGDYVWSQTLSDGVEYIAVEAFGTMDDADHFAEIWNGLDEKGTAAVILDLRGNGGGLIDCALEMLDLMLPEKTEMVTCRWRRDQGGEERIWTDGGGLPLNGIYVLVDENTASAAEMMAACLKDAGAATLIGKTTYGKSLGQYHLTLASGDSLIITTLEMRTPKTGVWEGKGVAPDIAIDSLVSVGEYVKGLPALPTDRALLYGEESTAVRALADRLRLLGYLEQTSDTLDADVLDAVRAFQADAGLEQTLCADIGTLGRINSELNDAAGYYLDGALEKALSLAQEDAEQPLRYVTTKGGDWKTAA